MPRTKLSKNTKRNRENATEQRIANALRDFDTQVEDVLVEMDLKYQKNIENISHLINVYKQKTSQHILSMTIKDIMECGAKTIGELSVLDHTSMINSTSTINTNSSTNTILSKCHFKDDEGYNTEGSNISTSVTKGNASILLSTSKIRRSKSAGNFTPLISHSKKAGKTPLLFNNQKNRLTPITSSHISRSKFRTPLTNRGKAVSADRFDRGVLNEPIAMFRYANIGETIISLSGSPVIMSNQTLENKANVNIPVKNGILTLRPTETKTFDDQFVDRIDMETVNHLKTLQRNLHMLTTLAETKLK